MTDSIEMFRELTNAQLKEECKDLGIKVFSEGQTPTKAEYFTALEKRFSYEPDSTDSVEEEVKPAKVVVPKQSKAKLARLDMMRKDRVIIHDVQDNQSKDKDELLSVSWGNRLLPSNTDFVALNGLPQYVRNGALKNMEEATTVIHTPNPNGGVTSERVPRFVINRIAGLTKDELEKLADQQRMRNSKHA